MKSRKGKTLECKICGTQVHNCGEDAVKVTCCKCVTKMMATGITFDEDKEIDKEINNN